MDFWILQFIVHSHITWESIHRGIAWPSCFLTSTWVFIHLLILYWFFPYPLPFLLFLFVVFQLVTFLLLFLSSFFKVWIKLAHADSSKSLLSLFLSLFELLSELSFSIVIWFQSRDSDAIVQDHHSRKFSRLFISLTFWSETIKTKLFNVRPGARTWESKFQILERRWKTNLWDSSKIHCFLRSWEGNWLMILVN